MSTLLKARDTHAQFGVRSFEASYASGGAHKDSGALQISETDFEAASAHESAEPQSKIPPSELEQLKTYTADLEKQLEHARAQFKKQRQEGFAEGLLEGRKLAQGKEQEKLDLLSQGISEARDLLSDRVDQSQSLAIAIAHAALLRIVGDRGHYAELVADIIAHRAQELKSELILGVKVSAEDFGTQAALEELGQRTGRTDISADHRLQSGACLFALSLGHMDASLPTQWTKLTELFARLEDKDGLP
jgi:type III secretion protein L